MNPKQSLRQAPALLVVDDDSVFRQTIAELLREAGFEVSEAANGAQALSICGERDVALCLLDVQMPGLSGLDVANRLGQTPVLFLSQVEDKVVIENAIRERAIGARTLGYLIKPVDPDKLVHTVKTAVGVARDLSDKQTWLEAIARSIEDERRAIARELHDALGQQLVALQWEARAIQGMVDPDAKEINAHAQRIVEGLQDLYQGVNKIIDRLRPEVLDQLGLRKSVEALVVEWRQRATGCQFDLSVEDDVDAVDEHISSALYRVLGECMTNIAKHAAATQVRVSLARMRLGPETGGQPQEVIQLKVTDNGRGFDAQGSPSGVGLHGMQERVGAIGGHLEIQSQPGQGTTIVATIPVRRGPPGGG